MACLGWAWWRAESAGESAEAEAEEESESEWRGFAAICASTCSVCAVWARVRARARVRLRMRMSVRVEVACMEIGGDRVEIVWRLCRGRAESAHPGFVTFYFFFFCSYVPQRLPLGSNWGFLFFKVTNSIS